MRSKSPAWVKVTRRAKRQLENLNTSVVTNPHSFEVKRDGNGQEYVETCNEWVRATLVMFDDEPHIRVQEHHEAGSGRLHLGPLIPLREWFGFKENVDRLVGPYMRDPRTPLARRTLAGALEYSILEAIAVLSERRRQAAIGGWSALIRDRIPEPAENNDLLFAFKRLWKRGILRLIKTGGQEYSGNTADDRWFFSRVLSKQRSHQKGGATGSLSRASQ